MPKGVPASGFRMTKNRARLGLTRADLARQVSQAPAPLTVHHTNVNNVPMAPVAPAVLAVPFSINQRFEFIEKMVSMVARGIQPSGIITGKGGLGKTYTVISTLKKLGYEDYTSSQVFNNYSEDDDEDDSRSEVLSFPNGFRIIKGYSSAKGLFRSLYENRRGILVFDDTDAVLDHDVSVNLLKAALDSYSSRTVSWNADLKDKDLPKTFEFEGRVIFISNRDQDSIDQAIRSRSMMIDLSMTQPEMLERMEFIAKQSSFMPEIQRQYKLDAMLFLKNNIHKANDVSLRTLISIIKIRQANEDWETFAEYILNSMPQAV